MVLQIAIYGAGAIGGYLGALLSLSGEDVTLIARGAHLEAMQRHGVRLLIDGEERVAHPRCIEDPSGLGPQDYVVLALKAHQVAGVVDRLPPLIGPQTAVVTAQNGVPWWFFYGVEGEWRDRGLESADPGGVLWDGIGPQRVIGSVVWAACEVVEPGVIRHIEHDRVVLGEPDGTQSERARRLAAALSAAGIRSRVHAHIRSELWVKLWGNVAFNPISALTRATLDEICADPGTRALARAVMLEVQAVAEALGERFRIDVDQRIEGAAQVGAHRTSMLQDLERGRALEVDPIVGAVAELGRITGVATPNLDAVYALTRLLEQQVAGS